MLKVNVATKFNGNHNSKNSNQKWTFDSSCVSYLFDVSYVYYVFHVYYVFGVSYVLDVSEQTVFFHRTEEACVFYLLQNE